MQCFQIDKSLAHRMLETKNRSNDFGENRQHVRNFSIKTPILSRLSQYFTRISDKIASD